MRDAQHYAKHVFVCTNLRELNNPKGSCWDNACVESFFGSLKDEIGDVLQGASRAPEFVLSRPLKFVPS